MLFLSHLHADLRQTLATRRGATANIGEAPTGAHKVYPRMPHITLPSPEHLSMPFSDTINKRKSPTEKESILPFSVQRISTLFGNSLKRHKESSRRQYPSGGNFYPVEVYMVTKALEGYPPSVIHYDPTAHRLEILSRFEGDMQSLIREQPVELAYGTLVVFTSVWKRTGAKYGDFAYLLALLEAGHMAQNLLLSATASGSNARPIMGFFDQKIIDLLDIDPEEEQPVYTVAVW